MKSLLSTFIFGLALIISFTSCEKAPPAFSIGYSGNLFEGESVSFQASSTAYDSYQWNFGNGSFGSGSSYSNTYSTAGTYTVELIVTDGGKNYTSSQVITIKKKPIRILVKRINLTTLDLQSNWDPLDASGPDVYLKLTQDIYTNGSLSVRDHYISPSLQDIVSSHLPLVYAIGVEIPFEGIYNVNVLDSDGPTSDIMATDGSFDATNDFPFTNTILDVTFPSTSTSGTIEIEYIY